MLRVSKSLPRLITVLQPLYVFHSTGPRVSSPLNLFVCAADATSDKVAAALVSSLKQQHGQGVKVYGVGGPALQSQGLQCAVSNEQYAQLATAEIIPPVHSYVTAKLPLPGVKPTSKSEYLKIFRDVIWEAALHGCNSRSKAVQQNPAAEPTQQQQQQKVVGGLPAQVTYDAVLSVGSPLASQQLLFALRQAEKAKVARLPVIVQYMPPGLWDYNQVSSSAKTWSQLADHVMCGLPHEPAVMHAAGAPASFVGHPVLEPLLRGQFSNLRRQVAQALQQWAAGDSSSSSSSSSRAAPLQSLFAVGNAAAFWQDFERMATHPIIRERRSSSSSSKENTSSDDGSSSTAAVSSARKRRAPAPSAAGATAAVGSKQAKPLLLCLLPGSTESEICSSMPAFDHITKQLVQQHPNLAVAVIVPDILVEAAQEAVQNFSVPAVVAPEDFVLSTNALAAAAAAVAHPGPQSLRAVAAGVPLVCVRDGSMILDGLYSWKNGKQLQFGCIPNQVLGCKAVPEVNLWARGGREMAVEEVGRLLSAAELPTAARPGSSNSSGEGNEWQQQRGALQEVLLKLVPPMTQQHAAAGGSDSTRGFRDTAAVSVQAPSEAAAAMLLELIVLRKQQEAEQLQALLSSRSSSASS